MIVLPKSTQFRPQPRFETIDLDGEQTLALQITPPTHEQYVRGLYGDSWPGILLCRLECVTGWNGVYQEREDGSRIEVPFTPESLQAVFNAFPGAIDRVLVKLRPYFERAQAAGKNSAAPSPAENATASPSTAALLSSPGSEQRSAAAPLTSNSGTPQ